MILAVTIPGEPFGAKRPRVVRRGGFPRAVMPDDHLSAEAYLVHHIRAALPPGHVALDEPVAVYLLTFHRRPKRLERRKDEGVDAWYTGKPDADNIAKLVLDACTKAGVWRDDTRVAVLRVERRYVGHPAAPGDIPRVRLEVGRAA